MPHVWDNGYELERIVLFGKFAQQPLSYIR
jgi:hypothetical protein